jgi:hypothetical protein
MLRWLVQLRRQRLYLYLLLALSVGSVSADFCCPSSAGTGPPIYVARTVLTLKSITFNDVVNVTLLCVALLVGSLHIRNLFYPPPPPPSIDNSNVQPGQKAPVLPAVNYASSPRTLVLFVHSQCHYCSESMSFYKTLLAEQHPRVKIVVAGREPESMLRSYLHDHGIEPPFVSALNGDADPRLRITPTIFAVTSAGTIEKVWIGLLDNARQASVTATLH